MNTITKKLIGAAIGGAAGYFVASVIVEYIAIKENEAQEQLATYPFNNKTLKKEEFEEMSEKSNRKKIDYTHYFESQNRPDLAALASKYNNDEVLNIDSEEDWPEEVLTEENVIDDVPQPIRLISMMEYANDDEYEHFTLAYYDDDVVTDGEDKPIENIEKLIGDEALVSFGYETDGDEDTVYVINDNLKTMYEVVRANKNYAVTKVRQARKKALSKKEEKNEEDNP